MITTCVLLTDLQLMTPAVIGKNFGYNKLARGQIVEITYARVKRQFTSGMYSGFECSIRLSIDDRKFAYFYFSCPMEELKEKVAELLNATFVPLSNDKLFDNLRILEHLEASGNFEVDL